MAGSTAPWQVVLLHHSPFSSSQHGSNQTVQLPYAHWGVDLVLGGHDHVYERIETDGTTFIVNGLGGRSIYQLNDPIDGSLVRYREAAGALFMNATATTLEGQFVSITGDRVDSFSVQPATGGPNVMHNLQFAGIAFVDQNEDALRDANEAPLGGVIVYVDQNRNWERDAGELTVVTNSAGEYSFTMTTPLEYRIIMEPPVGYDWSQQKFFRNVALFGPDPMFSFGTVSFATGDLGFVESATP